MSEKLYSVKIDKTGRYVTWCDDCWYEASPTEMRLFTKERAEEIRRQMKNHYVYKVTISNGEEVLPDPSAKPVEEKKPQQGWGMKFGTMK